MISNKIITSHYYQTKFKRVEELPSLRDQKSSRKSSVDEIFQRVKFENEDDDVQIISKTTRRISVKEPTQSQELISPKKRSVSQALRKFRQYSHEQEEWKKRDYYSQLESIIEKNLQQQTVKLKKLELHRNHVNQVLNSIINPNILKELKDAKITEQQKTMPKLNQNCELEKKGTILDPLKYNDLYQKLQIGQRRIRIPQGPMLSFRQFVKLHGKRLPKFFE
ncbi:hypothetical protein pb186bvf_001530 [Paramecium bursaria]